VPWRPIPPGAPPPLVDCGPDDPDAHVELPAAAREVFAVDGDEMHGALAEVDGVLCTRVVARGVGEDGEIGAERLDMALVPAGVVLRRRPIPGMAHHPFDLQALRRDWDRVLPDQRDASVLFAAILNRVLQGYDQALHAIRSRADEEEGHLLDRDRPIRELQRSLLQLTGELSAIRHDLLPLRNDLRELRELREPVARRVVSPRGARWLVSVEEDLRIDLPEALAVAEARIGNTLGQLQGERSEVTNRVVLALTIVTATFFVPTALTGLYGMNVPLPFQHERWVFYVVVVLAVVLFGFGLAAIRRLGLWHVLRREAAQPLRRSAGSPAPAARSGSAPPPPPG
jgi:Mg2+ and Co2+ transporter CorA